ncbi:MULTISPECIES: hypothetical protein [Arcobacteraceae]|uniref:hypothetical protein n=1 Tax=Arcobacteraceae TaxID=2808963 RepID=UPI000DEB4CB4|nr:MULTISPECIES: hypothetical protein [Arcobacteraceae]MBL3520251.1 hypothetical protein [Aliarcobacter lanthieri]RBQ26061.1 hypothetical protein CRU88_09610 [Arcobacter sp. CECT 9188]
MNFELNEKQLRIRYIRVLEKFFTRTISLLKLENFDKDVFIKRTFKNYEDMCKTPKVELYTDYYTSLNLFIEKSMNFVKNPSQNFEDERLTLLKDANLLQKEKNKSRYKKDKHKKDRFNDGY